MSVFRDVKASEVIGPDVKGDRMRSRNGRTISEGGISVKSATCARDLFNPTNPASKSISSLSIPPIIPDADPLPVDFLIPSAEEGLDGPGIESSRTMLTCVRFGGFDEGGAVFAIGG